MGEWYTVSPSPWSILLYAIWAWWASKKITIAGAPLRHRLGAWVQCVWVVGVVVLVGDIQWVISVWIKWSAIYPAEKMLLIVSQIRNIAMLAISVIMSWDLWKQKIIQWDRTVVTLWGVNCLYLLLWFGLAPNLEWTHWVYALENDYSCWPYTWGIGYIVGRIITTAIFWKTWHVE